MKSISDNWVVRNLEKALATWNEKLAELWQLVTQTPETFKGGQIWGVIVNIHSALVGVGYGLLAYVFDVSQTEGRELPSLGVDELTGDVPNFDAMFSAIEAISPVPVEFRPESAAKGCFNHLERKIYVNEGMSQVQTLKTLIHETAHALLHDSSVLDDEIPKKDRHTKEVEAESIAYVVCQHFGIDTSDYSFPYVTGWSRGKELPELKASLECISRTATEMIDSVEKRCLELTKSTTDKDSKNAFHRETHNADVR